MDFNSSSRNDTCKTNSLDSPGSNPFDTLSQVADSFPKFDMVKDQFLCSKDIDNDYGRESLGILHVDLNSIKFDDANWLNVPEIRLDNENLLQLSGENLSSDLNRAFLYSHRSNTLSTGSSVPPSPLSLPESLEFWELSKILSASSLINSGNVGSFSTLNKAFVATCNKSQLFLDMAKERRNSLELAGSKHWLARIHSLPDVLDGKDVNNEKVKEMKLPNLFLRNFRKSESLFKKSFTLPQVLIEHANEDNEFNDSVFIEAKHVASKIADNSILNLAEAELYSLDCTSEPELLNVTDTTEEENVVSTEKVFKTVDKMIPSTNNPFDANEKCSGTNLRSKSPDVNPDKTTDSTGSSISSLSRSECIQNLSEIFTGDNRKLSTSRLSQCSNNSKSKDAKLILHNLSEILSTDNPSAQQKSEGQNLLFSLADMLCSSDHGDSLNEREHSQDSGHSSIDHDLLPANKHEHVCCDVLDLRINNSGTPAEDPKPLDLSTSKKSRLNDNSDFGNVKATESHNEAFVRKSLKGISECGVNKTRNESAHSNDSKNGSSIKSNVSNLASFGKFKPKKIGSKVVPEKGPLKAMIPVGNMARPKGVKNGRFSTTPTKNSQYTSGYKVKRTSTPKTDSKPQPVAQSTPDGNSNIKKGIPTPAQLRQSRYGTPVSPLARTNSMGSESAVEMNAKNKSGSEPNLMSSYNSKNTSTLNNSNKLIMFRRRSASDIKISKDPNKFKRSNTIDKDSEIAKTINRVRENIEKARNSSATNAKSTQSKLILGEKNRVSTSSNIKPCNLVNKMRRNSGKENA
ncbi:hypothetical protein Trydic_g17930 [Trypoxylus dichotomus]